MIIAVDFDGTISRGKFPAIDGSNHTLANRSGNYMMKDIKSLFGRAVLVISY